jgi:hypothetical protein
MRAFLNQASYYKEVFLKGLTDENRILADDSVHGFRLLDVRAPRSFRFCGDR